MEMSIEMRRSRCVGRHGVSLNLLCMRRGEHSDGASEERLEGVNRVRQFGENHKVKLGKNRSKTNGVKLSKMASGLWVSLRHSSVLFEAVAKVEDSA